ncbi:unnamed protein product [Miscanthus lutarioriparius]|uniref:Uncharacterized protein n=1 Tax=Miscanthus lutarioriparius TaxID=422564 RepID=A0A811PWG8_9POAL|nr:unnamed protein product [Miscanthus lutarioriparius]
MAGSESGDDDDGPTINDELRATGQIPDDEDDMGDAAHLLFGRSAAPTNRDDAAASAAATSDAASLASSTTTGAKAPRILLLSGGARNVDSRRTMPEISVSEEHSTGSTGRKGPRVSGSLAEDAE